MRTIKCYIDNDGVFHLDNLIPNVGNVVLSIISNEVINLKWIDGREIQTQSGYLGDINVSELYNANNSPYNNYINFWNNVKSFFVDAALTAANNLGVRVTALENEKSIDSLTKSFTLSEQINKGKFVRLKSDGTIESIKYNSNSYGSTILPKENNSASNPILSMVVLPNNNILQAYADDAGLLKIRLIHTTGTRATIILSEIVLPLTSRRFVQIDYDSANPTKFMIAISYNYGLYVYPCSIISDRYISMGALSNQLSYPDSGYCWYGNYDSASSFLTIGLNDSNNNLLLNVATQSTYNVAVIGNSQNITCASGSTNNASIESDYTNSGKYLIVYTAPTTNILTAKVVSVSGTTTTLGTAINVSAEVVITQYHGMINVTTNKVVVIYSTGTDTRLAVFSLSGTTLTAQSNTQLFSSSSTQLRVNFSIFTDQIVYSYYASGLYVNILTLSTYSIGTIYTPVLVETNLTYKKGGIYRTGSNCFIEYHNSITNLPMIGLFSVATNQIGTITKFNYRNISGSSESGTRLKSHYNYSGAVPGSDGLGNSSITWLTLDNSSNLNNFDILGIVQGVNGTNLLGSNVYVKLLGAIDSSQTSLVINNKYYIKPDGTLTNINHPDYLFIGKAISTTELKTKEII